MKHALAITMLMSAAAIALTGCEREPTEADAVAAGFEAPTAMPRADFATLLERRFSRFDINGDGSIDGTEAGAARGDMLKTLDADRDGAVSRAEFVAGRLARFDRTDLDRNGVVTNKERSATPPTR